MLLVGAGYGWVPGERGLLCTVAVGRWERWGRWAGCRGLAPLCAAGRQPWAMEQSPVPGRAGGWGPQCGGLLPGAGTDPPAGHELPALPAPGSAPAAAGPPAALQLIEPRSSAALASRLADTKRFVMCWSSKRESHRPGVSQRWRQGKGPAWLAAGGTRREPRSALPPALGLARRTTVPGQRAAQEAADTRGAPSGGKLRAAAGRGAGAGRAAWPGAGAAATPQPSPAALWGLGCTRLLCVAAGGRGSRRHRPSVREQPAPRAGKRRAGAALGRAKGCKSPRVETKQIAVRCSNSQNLEASFKNNRFY